MANNYNLAKNYLDGETVEYKKIRDGLGHGMAELGAIKKDMVVLGADTIGSSRANFFCRKVSRTIYSGWGG